MQPVQNSNTDNKSRVFRISVIVSLIILLGLSTTALLLQQKADSTNKQRSQTLEKRIADLEAEDTFADSQIAKDRYQAVFLSNDQVYFGKITKVTEDTIRLEYIFYLNEGSMDSTDMSLTKLGDEVHAPDDVMILERKNVAFWENLKPDGQVAKAIAEYKKSN